MKLIPKYQNAGLVTRQDNTYVAKPTIPLKPIKRTYTPTQSYVSQDNRSEWQREQGSKKADEEYKKYVEDKKMQQGLENLNGFLNFVDAATITAGVGKGLSLIGKSVGKQIAKGMVSREFRRQSRNLPTPSNILPNNIGWGPKQSIHVVHDTHTPSKLQLYNPERWDAVHEDAPKVGIWYQGKLGNPRTAANHSIPGKAEKAAKARERFAKRPYRIEGDLELERPIITVGDVPNRVALERAADKMNADGVVFNNVYDNGYSNNQVIFSFKEGLTNQLVKRKIDSYGINPTFHTTPNDPNVNTFRLMKERLHNGGFDRLDQHGSHKFTDEAKKHILNSKPELVDSKILGNEPGGSVYRKGYFVNRDELDKRTTYQVLDIGSHELAHYIYRPNYKESLRLAGSVPQKFNDKNMAAYFTKNGATEQSARGTQLKNYFGFNRGEQNITPEMWEYAKKNYVKDTGVDNNMTEWFNSVPDEYVPQFLDWLNDNAPMLVVPMTVGIGLNNE